MPDLYFRASVYLNFEPEEGTSVEELQEWLRDACVLDFDTEGEGNPHGWCGASIGWDDLVAVPEAEAEHGGVKPARDGQRVLVRLLDREGHLVEELELDANEAADRARTFVLLHGADPDEAGRGSQPGSIQFVPIR